MAGLCQLRRDRRGLARHLWVRTHDDLYDDDRRSYSDDDAPRGPTFKQAMANVRSDAKTDKRLARQLEPPRQSIVGQPQAAPPEG